MESSSSSDSPRCEEQVIRVGNESLAVSTFYGTSRRAPRVISYHGFGQTATRHRIRYILNNLALHDISSTCFDFSGNGESTGLLESRTLRLRLTEAKAVTERLIGRGQASIFGTSMGGFLAALLAPVLQPRDLILFAPAAYPENAMDLFLDERFTSIARRSGAHLNSPAFAAINRFEGNLLIFSAGCDSIISQEVIDGYFLNASRARSRRVVRLPDSDHKIHLWLENRDSERALVMDEILTVLSKS